MEVKHPTMNEIKEASKKIRTFFPKEAKVVQKWYELTYNHVLTTSRGLFSLGKLVFGFCNSVDKDTMMNLSSI